MNEATRAVGALIDEFDSPPVPIRLMPEPTPLETLTARVAQLERRLEDETASRLFFQSMLGRVVEKLNNRVAMLEGAK